MCVSAERGEGVGHKQSITADCWATAAAYTSHNSAVFHILHPPAAAGGRASGGGTAAASAANDSVSKPPIFSADRNLCRSKF